LFYNNEKSRKHLEEAASKWSYAGRLWAEIIWMHRAKGE
jgi:hypothetical protein